MVIRNTFIKCCFTVVMLQDECTEVHDVSELPQLTTNPDDYEIFQAIGKGIILPAGTHSCFPRSCSHTCLAGILKTNVTDTEKRATDSCTT